MQITTLGAQSGSKLEDMDQNAKSVAYRQFLWLTCHHEQAVDKVTSVTADPLPQKILTPSGWSLWSFWTFKRKKSFFNLQFSCNCTNCILQWHPKEFMRYLFEWMVNLLRRNKPPMQTKQHFVKSQKNVLLFLRSNNTEAETKNFGFQKSPNAHKSQYSSLF